MKVTVTDYDHCPNCKKKTKTMMHDHGALISIPAGVVCSKCGTHYALQDHIGQLLKKKDSQIIMPGQEPDETIKVVKSEKNT